MLKDLYTTFFRIGLFTFGGGYAMLPMLEREVVERHKWATNEELLDFYAVSQCTPGVIAVNVATMIGCRQGGLTGAAVATTGVVSPSLLIILAIAKILSTVAHLAVIQHAFGGIRVAVAVLILAAIVRLYKSSVKDWVTGAIFAVALGMMLFTSISPVWFVAAAAVVGIVLKKFKAGDAK